jgi:hypothetical protein
MGVAVEMFMKRLSLRQRHMMFMFTDVRGLFGGTGLLIFRLKCSNGVNISIAFFMMQ